MRTRNPQPGRSRHARKGRALMLTLLAWLGLTLFLPATPAQARVFWVGTVKDFDPGGEACLPTHPTAQCSLRAAIRQSNALTTEANTIRLEPTNYLLEDQLPSIREGVLTIAGDIRGGTTISGACPDRSSVNHHKEPGNGECPPGKDFRVLRVDRQGTLFLYDVTVRDGQAGFGGGVANFGSLFLIGTTVTRNHAHNYGGGIYNEGYLDIQDSTIRDNFNHRPSPPGQGGGGIFNKNGTVWISYSTINNNTAPWGGGVQNGLEGQGDGVLAIFNSTISGNTGGGIRNEGNSEAWLKSVTITQNSESAGVDGRRGKVYFDSTIIANNPGGDCRCADSLCSGKEVVSLGGNLLVQRACEPSHLSDWPSGWPPSPAADQIVTHRDFIKLGALDDNGGTTCTHALLDGSPALNAGWTGEPGSHPFACEAYDQRWFARSGRCDIGAFEVTWELPLPAGLTCKAPPLKPPVVAPSNLVARGTGMRQIDLSWQDNSDNETSFKIQQMVGARWGGFWTDLALVVPANATNYAIKGLSVGTTHFYRIAACIGDVCPWFSPAVSATTEDNVPPWNLSAWPTSSTQIELSWRDNPIDRRSFRLERKTGMERWKLVKSGPQSTTVDVTTYVDRDVRPNTKYDYRIQGCMTGLPCSEFSSPEVSATTPAVPAITDLVVNELYNPPASVAAGKTFAARDAVLNQGTVEAGASTTRFYLSVDQARDAADVLLTGTRSAVALQPGQVSKGSTTVTVPASTPRRAYYLIACADDLGKVAESNEGNNCRSSTTKIQVQ